jgi:hypothetical protein
MASPSDNNDHLIEMPMVAGLGTHMAQVSSNRPAKFEESAPHGFVRNIQAPLGKQIFHISVAQSEPGVEPNGVANDVRWKSVTLKADVVHPARLHRRAD